MTALCIPRVEKELSKQYIYSKVNALNLGNIKYIKEAPCKKHTDYKKVFIQYSKMNENDLMEQQLNEKGYINVVHQHPWFWKVHKAYYQ
jgi:hypothetical protein